jgi:predicted permease
LDDTFCRVIALGHLVLLTAPLFLLVLGGYALARLGRWSKTSSEALTHFVFTVAMPALLFRMMSDFSRLPRVDARLLVAFFGGCLVVYVIGRVVGRFVFRMDGVAQSVFAVGGLFSNNVLLGVPLAKVLLGENSLPAVSLVLVFNSLLLWTLVTVSVEIAREGALSPTEIGRTLARVMTNPLIAAILLGTAFGFTGLALPDVLDRTLFLVTEAALPLSLIALGMGLAQYGTRSGIPESVGITALKLFVHPAAVFVLAWLLRLPPLETAVVVMLAAMPVGANVYLMARQFDVLSGPVATSMVLTTALAVVATPLTLALLGVKPP